MSIEIVIQYKGKDTVGYITVQSSILQSLL